MVARPRSDNKRNAILQAATRILVIQGLNAPTAGIAKEAGIPNGSLFTYFPTKAELLNTLYVELKAEMARAALSGMPKEDTLKAQFFHVWQNWIVWALAHPEKRRAMAQLEVSDQITVATRHLAAKAMAEIATLLEQIRTSGHMSMAPSKLFLAMMNAVAEATMDAVTGDHSNAAQHSRIAFEGLWRMVA